MLLVPSERACTLANETKTETGRRDLVRWHRRRVRPWAFPFQPRFSPVSVRRPTVRASPGFRDRTRRLTENRGPSMPRFRRALACAAMAMAAAGGGLAVGAAGATPAYASTPAHP